jgi:hypothetical protein
MTFATDSAVAWRPATQQDLDYWFSRQMRDRFEITVNYHGAHVQWYANTIELFVVRLHCLTGRFEVRTEEFLRQYG